MPTYLLITRATEATTQLCYYFAYTIAITTTYIRISSMPTYLLITRATETTTHLHCHFAYTIANTTT